MQLPGAARCVASTQCMAQPDATQAIF